MNFKEQYKATFSEIHASEELTQKLLEAKNMEGKTIKITKGKKKIMAILIAAALAVTSAVAVSAAALNDSLLDNIKMYINGKEVSASDYFDDGSIKLVSEDDDENVYVFEMNDLPEDLEDVEIEMHLDELDDDGVRTSSVTITQNADEEVNASAE